MTADAKVGLLLGLFFIVIIAFLVNGLPNFIREENTSPPNASIIAPTGQDIVLDNSASDAVHRLYPSRSIQQRATQPPQETIVLDSSTELSQQVEIPDIVPPPQSPVVQNTPSAIVQETEVASKVRTHVVKSGQTLPVIAKQYYGPEEGNRLVVIQKLYEINSGTLKSPDHVYVGQKLSILSKEEMEALINPSSQAVQAPSPTENFLKNFPAIFERVDKKDARSVSEYTIQEGDSLWSIAEENLGDGNRYKEIAKLNKGTIKSVNDLVVGTRLKIPPQ